MIISNTFVKATTTTSKFQSDKKVQPYDRDKVMWLCSKQIFSPLLQVVPFVCNWPLNITECIRDLNNFTMGSHISFEQKLQFLYLAGPIFAALQLVQSYPKISSLLLCPRLTSQFPDTLCKTLTCVSNILILLVKTIDTNRHCFQTSLRPELRC